jgi:hypothetical protein
MQQQIWPHSSQKVAKKRMIKRNYEMAANQPVLILLISLTLSLLSCSDTPQRQLPSPDYTEDFEYIVSTLSSVHPSLVDGWSEEQNDLIENIKTQLSHVEDDADFVSLVSPLFLSFNDAHTGLGYSWTGSNPGTKLPLIWLNEGLFVFEKWAGFEAGDEIIKIRQMKTERILEILSEQYISRENDYWLRARATSFAFHRFFIDEYSLVKNDVIPVTVMRNGRRMRVDVSPNVGGPGAWYNRYSNYKTEVYIESDLTYFRMDTCRPDSSFNATLKRLFTRIKEDNIGKLAIDLRYNSGGNSAIIYELMRYFEQEEFVFFGTDVRGSPEASSQRQGFPDHGFSQFPPQVKQSPIEEKYTDLIFRGDLYILTSNYTFSSGNWIATVFQDNGLGKIVGEPTGNAPSSFGDILSFRCPSSLLSFTVSCKQFVRPISDEGVPADALYPDLPIPLRLEDIINERDAALEAIMALPSS